MSYRSLSARRRSRAGLGAIPLVFLVTTHVATSDRVPAEDPPREGLEVLLKVDFDSGANPFAAEGNAAVSLDDRTELSLAGRSLRVRRSEPGGYFGAATSIEAAGPTSLRIAFCLRTRGMPGLAVNFHDEIRGDNTTPAAPAGAREDAWTPVVFPVSEFHHNSAPPEEKLTVPTLHTRLLFHGPEIEGQSGEFWVDKLVVYRGPDRDPPDPPTGVKAQALEDGRVLVSWAEPIDDGFPVVYSVHRCRQGGSWEKVGESLQTRYADSVPEAGPYSYRVTAADYENNVSQPSAEATVTVPAGDALRAPETSQVADRRAYAENVRRIHAAGAGSVRRDVFLAFGDSITAANLYTYELAAALGRGLFVRRGYGGMRTDFAERRIEELLSEVKPEFAVVMFGTNDSKDPESIRRAMESLAHVIDACARRGVVPVLATIPPRGYERGQEGERRYNESLIALCRERKIPVSYVFEEMIEGDLRSLLGDGVHLTPERGNRAAGTALRRTFDQVYFALRDSGP